MSINSCCNRSPCIISIGIDSISTKDEIYDYWVEYTDK